MDAPGRLNEREADRVLCDLFQESGPLQAPDHIDERILAQLTATMVQAPRKNEPLMPLWAWLIGIVAVVAVIVFASSSNGAAGTGTEWDAWVPSFSISSIVGSPWLMMSVIAGSVLLALDTWLGQRQLAPRRH